MKKMGISVIVLALMVCGGKTKSVAELNKEMGEKFCKKMMGCVREKMKPQLSKLPPAMRKKMQGMFSTEKCIAKARKKPMISETRKLTSDELKKINTCMTSMLNANCTQLTGRNGLKNLNGCEEMEKLRNK